MKEEMKRTLATPKLPGRTASAQNHAPDPFDPLYGKAQVAPGLPLFWRWRSGALSVLGLGTFCLYRLLSGRYCGTPIGVVRKDRDRVAPHSRTRRAGQTNSGNMRCRADLYSPKGISALLVPLSLLPRIMTLVHFSLPDVMYRLNPIWLLVMNASSRTPNTNTCFSVREHPEFEQELSIPSGLLIIRARKLWPTSCAAWG